MTTEDEAMASYSRGGGNGELVSEAGEEERRYFFKICKSGLSL